MRAWTLLFLTACSSGGGTDADASSDSSTKPDAPIGGDASTESGADAALDAPANDASDAATDAGTDAGAGAYSAFGLPGGLDRVRIVKTAGNQCFYIQLVTPSMMGQGLTLPMYWGFDGARAMEPAQACNPNYKGPIINQYDATSQSGTIVFPGNPQIPQSIQSISATINFANNPMWCPPSATFAAMNIPVQ